MREILTPYQYADTCIGLKTSDTTGSPKPGYGAADNYDIHLIILKKFKVDYNIVVNCNIVILNEVKNLIQKWN